MPYSTDPLITEIAELKDRITFLNKTVDGLEEEVSELRQNMFNNEAVFKEVVKSLSDLEKVAKKQSAEFNVVIERQKQKIQQLQEGNKFLYPVIQSSKN